MRTLFRPRSIAAEGKAAYQITSDFRTMNKIFSAFRVLASGHLCSIRKLKNLEIGEHPVVLKR